MLAHMPTRTVSVLRTHDNRVIPAPGVYDIDCAHTSVEFVARHLMITKVRGRFDDVHGRITIAAEPANSHVEATISAASLSTGNDDRDNHLRGPDFFDVANFPTLSFASTDVRARGDGTWVLDGDLTVRDVTRRVTLEVGFEGADVSPLGDERIGFNATTEIDREDFGLTWNVALETGGLLVGKIARIELAVEAIAVGDVA